MITIYEKAIDGAFTGQSRQVEPDAPRPVDWVTEAPPDLGEGETAVWLPIGVWKVTTSWPTEEALSYARNERRAKLLQVLRESYVGRLGAEVSYDFVDAISITDLAGAASPSTVLAMQMSKEDQDNWRTKWSEALSSDPTDVLVIICEDRWYVAAHPYVLIAAFKYVTQSKQMLLAGYKTLERLLNMAETDEALNNLETAINNPTWGIA